MRLPHRAPGARLFGLLAMTMSTKSSLTEYYVVERYSGLAGGSVGFRDLVQRRLMALLRVPATDRILSDIGSAIQFFANEKPLYCGIGMRRILKARSLP